MFNEQKHLHFRNNNFMFFSFVQMLIAGCEHCDEDHKMVIKKTYIMIEIIRYFMAVMHIKILNTRTKNISKSRSITYH